MLHTSIYWLPRFHVSDLLAFAQVDFKQFVGAFFEAKRRSDDQVDLMGKRGNRRYGATKISGVLIGLVFDEHF